MTPRLRPLTGRTMNRHQTGLALWEKLRCIGRVALWLTMIFLAVIASAMGLALLSQVPRIGGEHGKWSIVVWGLVAVVATVSPWWALVATMVERDQSKLKAGRHEARKARRGG